MRPQWQNNPLPWEQPGSTVDIQEAVGYSALESRDPLDKLGAQSGLDFYNHVGTI